jgi:hypothetical protein
MAESYRLTGTGRAHVIAKISVQFALPHDMFLYLLMKALLIILFSVLSLSIGCSKGDNIYGEWGLFFPEPGEIKDGKMEWGETQAMGIILYTDKTWEYTNAMWGKDGTWFKKDGFIWRMNEDGTGVLMRIMPNGNLFSVAGIYPGMIEKKAPEDQEEWRKLSE